MRVTSGEYVNVETEDIEHIEGYYDIGVATDRWFLHARVGWSNGRWMIRPYRLYVTQLPVVVFNW